jgi:hypothetical protein
MGVNAACGRHQFCGWALRAARIAQFRRLSMEWHPFRPTNPEGWQKVAGGRSAAETPGRHWMSFTTPAGWRSSATLPGSIRSFYRRSGGIAALNPRLPSDKPPACSGNGKTNEGLKSTAAAPFSIAPGDSPRRGFGAHSRAAAAQRSLTFPTR